VTAPERPQDWPSPAEFIEEARKHGGGLLGPQAKLGPYTGIAGFTTAAEVRSVAADAYTISGFGTPHFGQRRLAIGVLVSWETLNGEAPRKYPERYPPIGRVREILDAAAEPYVHRSPWQPENEGTVFDLKARCLRLIHYNSKEPNLLAQLDRLCEIAGENIDGFQLNMAWPPEDDLKWWAEEHPTMRLILQVNRKMFSNVVRSPQLLMIEIDKRKYLPSITDILFDMSGGAGQPADLTEARTVLEALYGAFGGLVGIGLAGGLEWHSLWKLQPLFDRWPDLSIDAEGRLRDKSDALNAEMAREYARRAFGVMPLRKPG